LWRGRVNVVTLLVPSSQALVLNRKWPAPAWPTSAGTHVTVAGAAFLGGAVEPHDARRAAPRTIAAPPVHEVMESGLMIVETTS
jgi:hypothetical protein